MIQVNTALFTDLYELTMAQGYWKYGLDSPSVFDMFFRRNPFRGGYAVFAGLKPLLESLENLSFKSEDLEWLERDGRFEPAFIKYLSDFSFRGDIWAVSEGELVFPHEPLIKVRGNLVEAQLIEGLILNIINFQSLIATKACRLKLSAAGSELMEFGLRRAQGPNGALSASRAAYLGGVSSSSNSLAARIFSFPASGTMAHSWIMAFPDELAAFRAYAELYPDSSVFLIDTFDTLGSGIRNAIKVGLELKARGKKIGVRLDSGDMDYLSRKVREELDRAGLEDAFIVASNELDETIIETMTKSGTPIDVWGVGTRLVTGGEDSSFTGVYKLSETEKNDGKELKKISVMKFSENPEKSTNPGAKNAWRLYDSDGLALADVISREDEILKKGENRVFYHPYLDMRRFEHRIGKEPRQLLHKVMENGRILPGLPDLETAREKREASLAEFDPSYLRLLNPHRYRVSLTEAMRNLKIETGEAFRV